MGPGNLANNNLTAFGNILYSAAELIAEGNTIAACEQLWDAAQRADGAQPPRDFIGGEDAPVVYEVLLKVMDALGCE